MSPDWVAAIGQAAGAVFTASAVAAALGIAVNDSRSRRLEGLRRSLTQARLVLALPPTDPVETGQSSDGFKYEVTFEVDNFSDRPLLAVVVEMWDAGSDASWTATNSIVLPGNPMRLQLKAVTRSSGLKLGAWRTRWTDADGVEWYVNEEGGPLRYIKPDSSDLCMG